VWQHCPGWRDLTRTKDALLKGHQHLQFMYQTSGHHIANDMLSEHSACVYKARVLPVAVLEAKVYSHLGHGTNNLNLFSPGPEGGGVHASIREEKTGSCLVFLSVQKRADCNCFPLWIDQSRRRKDSRQTVMMALQTLSRCGHPRVPHIVAM
jgi:hypothetical protein